MSIYLIKPREKYQDENNWNDNPWAPWYDKAHGYVVSADNEKEAREMVVDKACKRTDKYDDVQPEHWLNEEYTICEELNRETEKGILLSDFRRA